MARNFQEALDLRNSQWKELVKAERSQGSSLLANKPMLLSRGIDWIRDINSVLGTTEVVLDNSSKFGSTIVEEFIEGVLSDINNPIEQDDIDTVNKALASLNLAGFKGMDSYTQKIHSALEWVNRFDQEVIGSGYTVEIEKAGNPGVKNGSSGVEGDDLGAATDVEELGADDAGQPEYKVTIKRDGQVIFPGEVSDCNYASLSAYANDLKSEMARIISDGISFENAVTLLTKPKVVRAEYKNLLKQIEKSQAKLDAFKKKRKGTDLDMTRVSINRGCVAVATTSGESSDDGTQDDGPQKDRQALDNLAIELAKPRESKLFKNLSFDQIEGYYFKSTANLIVDMTELKDAYEKISSKFNARNQGEINIKALSDHLVMLIKKPASVHSAEGPSSESQAGDEAESKDDSTEQPSNAVSEDDNSKELEKKELKKKIELVNAAKQFKQDFHDFAKRVARIEEHKAFLNERKDLKGIQRIKSNFNGKLAISKPLTALFLSGLAVAAASVVAAAATAAVLYSVAASLAMYSAQRLWAIRQISKRNKVSMADLSSDAIHYSSRLEAVAAIAPIFISIVAPVALPAKYAAQAAVYCGSIAMRAVYSAVASFFAQRFEVAFDTCHSGLPTEAANFVPQATVHMRTNLCTADEAVQVNNGMKAVRNYEVKPKVPKENGTEVELPSQIQSAHDFLDALNKKQLTADSIDGLPRIIQGIDPKSKDLEGFVKVANLLRVLQTVQVQVESIRTAAVCTELHENSLTKQRDAQYEAMTSITAR